MELFASLRQAYSLSLPVLFFGILGGSVFSSASAEERQVFAPEWVRSGLTQQQANASYLSHLEKREESFNAQFFDLDSSEAAKREYERTVIADEARENAGLEEVYEEESRFRSMRSRARHALRSAYKHRLKANSQRLAHTLENMPEEIRDPLSVIAVAASIYNGQGFAFEFMEGLRVTSRAALRDKEASFSMDLYDTGLSSTVYYNRNDQFAAALAQRLTPEVSAVVNSADNGSAQFVYSLSF